MTTGSAAQQQRKHQMNVQSLQHLQDTLMYVQEYGDYKLRGSHVTMSLHREPCQVHGLLAWLSAIAPYLHAQTILRRDPEHD